MVMRLSERAQLVVAAYVQWMPMDFASMKSGKHIPIGFATERNHYTFMRDECRQAMVGRGKSGNLSLARSDYRPTQTMHVRNDEMI